MPDDAPSLRNAWPVLTAAALAVLGVVGALLLGGTDERDPVLREGFALDLEDPWPLRGDAALVAGDALADLPGEWAAAAPLLAHEVDGTVEVVLLDGARRRWAVAQQGTSGWRVRALDLQGETGVLAARVDDRVVAVADPRVEEIDLVPDRDGLQYARSLEELDDGAGQVEDAPDVVLVAVGLVGADVVVQDEVQAAPG